MIEKIAIGCALMTLFIEPFDNGTDNFSLGLMIEFMIQLIAGPMFEREIGILSG